MVMQSGWIEIVFLAMLAGFIALRLYHVLGRRTGHEKPVSDAFRPAGAELSRPEARPAEREPAPLVELPGDIDPKVRPGVEAIAAADRSFSVPAFLAGAQGAYTMVLEAFWRGDTEALSELVADEVLADFVAAIEARADRGEQLDNRLLQVDRARIVGARMNGMMAEVAVQFDAEIVAVTRDSEGNVIEGDPNGTVETHDVWTFSRHVTSADPAWLLIATDEVAA
jgi:predicted lipid-binding transport protein (Tim44 family)